MFDIHFITTAKLLILTSHGHVELYGDLSMSPQPRASFALPVIGQPFCFRFQRFTVPQIVLASYQKRSIGSRRRSVTVVQGAPSLSYRILSHFFRTIPLTWFDATSKSGQVDPWSLLESTEFSLHSSPVRGVALVSYGRLPYQSHLASHFWFKSYMIDFNSCAVQLRWHMWSGECYSVQQGFGNVSKISVTSEIMLRDTD